VCVAFFPDFSFEGGGAVGVLEGLRRIGSNFAGTRIPSVPLTSRGQTLQRLHTPICGDSLLISL
jgi:hypothetical protein